MKRHALSPKVRSLAVLAICLCAFFFAQQMVPPLSADNTNTNTNGGNTNGNTNDNGNSGNGGDPKDPCPACNDNDDETTQPEETDCECYCFVRNDPKAEHVVWKCHPGTENYDDRGYGENVSWFCFCFDGYVEGGGGGGGNGNGGNTDNSNTGNGNGNGNDSGGGIDDGGTLGNDNSGGEGNGNSNGNDNSNGNGNGNGGGDGDENPTHPAEPPYAPKDPTKPVMPVMQPYDLLGRPGRVIVGVPFPVRATCTVSPISNIEWHISGTRSNWRLEGDVNHLEGKLTISVEGMKSATADWFGPHQIWTTATGPAGEDMSSPPQEVLVFYWRDALETGKTTKYPVREDKETVANWFVFYQNIPGLWKEPTYWDGRTIHCGYEVWVAQANQFLVFLGPAATLGPNYAWNCDRTQKAQDGIDGVGWVIRHEHQHRTSAVAWWGNKRPVESQDTDGDSIPDRMERDGSVRPPVGRCEHQKTLVPNAGQPAGTVLYQVNCTQTFYDRWPYSARCVNDNGSLKPVADRPLIHDCEDHCCGSHEPWHVGEPLPSVKALDWGNPGYQWPGLGYINVP